MDGTPPKEEDGLFYSVTRLFKTLRDVAENRVELFMVELKEERARFFSVLFLAAMGIVCAVMTLIMLTLTIMVIFWDTHRLLALSLLTISYAAAAVATFAVLRTRLQRWQAFSATLEQIKKDRACFKKPN